MNKIRKLEQAELTSFMELAINSYPVFEIKSPEQKQQLLERMIRAENEGFTSGYYGLFREHNLLGGMRFFNFMMNVYGKIMLTGGIGLVAVDLLHKKEKVARDMLAYFIRHYAGLNSPMVILHAFRIDFYRKMGFGIGTTRRLYEFKPGDLLTNGDKSKVKFIAPEEFPDVEECYFRRCESRHGMIHRSAFEFKEILGGSGRKVVGVYNSDKLDGYMVFTMKPGKRMLSDLLVHELIYFSPDALAQMMAFLSAQIDQIERIQINTHDEFFHYLSANPENNSPVDVIPLHHQICHEEIGVMYRIINTELFFTLLKNRKFGSATYHLEVDIKDSFFPENSGKTCIRFEDGYPQVLKSAAESDVRISMDIADFSALVMGCIPFKKLYDYALADISDSASIQRVNDTFKSGEKPMTHTRF